MALSSARTLLALCSLQPVVGGSVTERDPAYLGTRIGLTDLGQRLSRFVVCSACRLVMDEFRFRVARYIRKSMSHKKRGRAFDERSAQVCRAVSKMDLVVAEANGQQGLSRASDVAAQTDGHHRNITIVKEGPSLLEDVTALCNHFILGHRAELLAVINNWAANSSDKSERASAFDFFDFMCNSREGNADICKPDEVAVHAKETKKWTGEYELEDL